jgi:LPS sulfotransferase NodH
MFAYTASVLQDLLDGVASPKVDRDSSKLPSHVEAFGDVVHHVHLRRPAQVQGAIGSEQTDRAGPEDGDAIPL